MRLVKKYNGWNLMQYKDGPIEAHCPHCAYSAPDYIDTLETILFKYCPNCGSKLSDDECIVDLEQLCY